MARDTYKFWVNSELGVFYDAFGSNTTGATPIFIQGDTVDIEVHLVRWTQGAARFMEELEFPAGSTLRLAIGKVDASPTSGTFTVTYGANTTGALSYAVTAAQLQTALNGLASVTAAGGVTVTQPTSSLFKVVFNTPGVNSVLSIDATLLSPPSYSKVIELQAGTVSVPGIYALKVKQSPVVFQDDWDPISQPTLTTTTLTANKGKRVTIEPMAKSGSWTLTASKLIPYGTPAGDVDLTDWNTTVTKRLSVNAVASDFADFQLDATVVSNGVWDIAVKENYEVPVGYTMPFTATGDGLVGYVGKTAAVSFNTAEIEYLLNGNAQATALMELELEDLDGNKWTLLQANCVIRNDMIDSTTFNPLSLFSGLPEAPQDGQLYARKDGDWEAFLPEDNIGIPEAPVDGTPYLRKDGAWSADIDGGTY